MIPVGHAASAVAVAQVMGSSQTAPAARQTVSAPLRAQFASQHSPPSHSSLPSTIPLPQQAPEMRQVPVIPPEASAQAAPTSSSSLAGQEADEPVQTASFSQTPEDARQTWVESRNRSSSRQLPSVEEAQVTDCSQTSDAV